MSDIVVLIVRAKQDRWVEASHRHVSVIELDLDCDPFGGLPEDDALEALAHPLRELLSLGHGPGSKLWHLAAGLVNEELDDLDIPWERLEVDAPVPAVGKETAHA